MTELAIDRMRIFAQLMKDNPNWDQDRFINEIKERYPDGPMPGGSWDDPTNHLESLYWNAVNWQH